jgi:hypothetical protein
VLCRRRAPLVSLSLFVCLTSGPVWAAGPMHQRHWGLVWVHHRVELALS